MKRFAGEMEIANVNNDNNLATTPIIHSDDVHEIQPTNVIKCFTLDQIPVQIRLELGPPCWEHLTWSLQWVEDDTATNGVLKSHCKHGV